MKVHDTLKVKIRQNIWKLKLKGKAQFIFLCNPQNSSVNVCLIKKIKKHCHKKVIVCLNNFWKNIAAFVIFPTSIMVLFEIHQWFKVHFLNEFRDSFKEIKTLQLYHNKKKLLLLLLLLSFVIHYCSCC